ncbi:hypothetical protein ILUMI_21305 [Ignelater luminosus]|uniref:DUF659 domain-containing protein n=1 Tax=Ignelater luminosus TaxID=2038154 RepID=A0A8K0CFV9_IGNLU|nr:hypothetical protein ILUMI_21305 [Ignelater luminosus]
MSNNDSGCSGNYNNTLSNKPDPEIAKYCIHDPHNLLRVDRNNYRTCDISKDLNPTEEKLAHLALHLGVSLRAANKYCEEAKAKLSKQQLGRSTSILHGQNYENTPNCKDKRPNAYVVGIQCDGWSNIRNASIINFIVTTPQPVFYKTVSTEEHRHTGQYVAEQIEAVFTDIGINKVIACCTDNAANMKKTWDLLREKYTDKPISFYGCAAHTLNLLVNDITKLNTTDILINSAKAIIKVIKSKSVLTSAFFNLQRGKQEPRKCVFKLPVATRWASTVLSFESLLKNKNILKALAINDEYQDLIEKRNKTNILDDDIFWKRIESFLKILQPLKKWITVLESDEYLSSSEQDKILEAVQARRKMRLKPIHFSANILHPKLKGKHLSAGEIVQGLQYIHSLARHLSIVDENKVLENLADFRSNSGFWEMQFVQDSAINPNISPVTFWKGICTEFPLRFVAEAVLTMPATSAATEKRDPTDTNKSTVTLGLEEKTMATNQSEPGFSGWYSPRCVDQSSSSEDSKLYEEMDAVLYASDELEDEDHVDKDEDID